MSEPVFHLAAVPESADPGGDGPGARLRAAREKLGMSVEQICGELKLAPDQVEDLENDRYERIPGETYVRGYLRTYARVVKLPPEQVVEEYRQVRTFGEGMRPVMPASESQISLAERPFGMLATVLLMIAAGVAIGWWYTSGGGSEPAPLAEATETRALPGTGADATNQPAPEQGAGTAGGGATPAAVVPEPARAEFPAVHGGDGSETEAVQPQPVDVAPFPVEEQPAPPAAPAASDVVTLQFEQTSWAEVQDATGQRLLYQTVEAGRELVLSGEAPFAVVLGNAAGVSVHFNGERVSVAVEEAGTVSRFNLGEEESATE